jgi:hypothetical protein
MRKDDYLNDINVRSFVKWVLPMVNGQSTFKHCYHDNKRNVDWCCDNIYDAYKKYRWNFKSYFPNKNNLEVIGCCFEKSSLFLNDIKKVFDDSLNDKDSENIIKCSNAILKWGGVTNSNSDKLVSKKDSIIDYFYDVKNRLNPEDVSLNDKFEDILMNSGFTKIYSILIDDFIIYDSRVGAALGLLIGEFLKENNIISIPETLKFAYGKSRQIKNEPYTKNRRDPSTNQYFFPCLNGNNLLHINNNIRANWLLWNIAKNSKFNYEEYPLRSLESALFMIGYDVRSYIEKNNNQK